MLCSLLGKRQQLLQSLTMARRRRPPHAVSDAGSVAQTPGALCVAPLTPAAEARSGSDEAAGEDNAMALVRVVGNRWVPCAIPLSTPACS